MSTVMTDRANEVYGARTAELAMERLAKAAHPDSVFGQPIERGEMLVIPCCEIALGMGMGGGTGTGALQNKTSTPGGEGLGAGGGTTGRPVATIVMTRDAVRVVPIYDATKVALAGLTTAGFMVFWIARLVAALRPRIPRGRAARGGARLLAARTRRAQRLPRGRWQLQPRRFG